jgi:alpha-beta hydrolase superfamily lysophospholipase
MSRASVLTEHPHNLTAELFLAAGRRVVTFDLPGHGERVSAWGEGIAGFAAALGGGFDPFAEFVADGQHVLDHCVAQQLAAGGPIVACGISRAGYCALRLAAADARIAGVAALAPVTDWRRLSEFADLSTRPAVAQLAIEHWAAELAGRPVFLAIGNADQRVGTDACVQYALRLLAAEAGSALARSQVQLHVVEAEGHALPDEWRRAGAQFLLELAGTSAAEM